MASPAWPVHQSSSSGQSHWQPTNAGNQPPNQMQRGVFPGYAPPPFRAPNQLSSSPGTSSSMPTPSMVHHPNLVLPPPTSQPGPPGSSSPTVTQPLHFGAVRWQVPRPETSVLGARPGSGAPPYTGSGQWILPPPGQPAQRPPPAPFMFPPPSFPFQFPRPEGIHSFRPVGDHLQAAAGAPPAFGVWGETGAAAGHKELPDFHQAHRVNAQDRVSDSKSEKTLKHEVSEEDSWAAHKTEDGIIYYYNSVTGESTYEKPANFKGEANAAAQPTPIACDKLPGTDWLLVTTNDGKKYYYNPKTQATSWQVPAEIVDKVKKDDGGPISTPAAVTGGREAKGASSSGATALDTIKKKLQENTGNTSSAAAAAAGAPVPENEGAKDASEEAPKDKAKAYPEASTSDSSSDSEDEAPGVTKEDRIQHFKDLLKEAGVAPFSKWDKELPKILYDPRFKAIPSHSERRSIFEHYVRTRAEEERKEKRAAQKAAADGFKQLLEEASNRFLPSTTYESFANEWSKDPRFEALERKEREALLNERIMPLKKAEEDRLKAIHDAVATDFRAMLKERGDVTVTSRWSKVKDLVRNDPRYKAVKHDDREIMFDAYIGGLRVLEQEADRAAKAKREEENKLRDRERELRKRKEREEHELERVRAKARRKDAVTAYQSLLTERIKDADASWTESRPKLERDPLGRATNPELDMSDRERLFREHTKDLYERCEKEFRLLLADVVSRDCEGRDVMGSWSDAKSVFRSDQRFNRMPRRYVEIWWERFVQDSQRKHRSSFDNERDDARASSRRHR